MSEHPFFGFTRHGLPVHRRTVDHLPDHNTYARFNKRVALALTAHVGTMTCFWVFLVASLTVLPSVLYQMGVIGKHALVPAFMLTFGFELLMTWLFSTCIQLILLPGLMVGQNLQTEAADARAAKQFEDLEAVKDWLDLDTAGGLAAVMEQVREAKEEAASAREAIRALALVTGTPQPAATGPTPMKRTAKGRFAAKDGESA